MLFLFLLVGCQNDYPLDRVYYYDNKTYDVYEFLSDDMLMVYDIKDSIATSYRYKFFDSTVSINENKYSYTKLENGQGIRISDFGYYSETTMYKLDLNASEYYTLDSTKWIYPKQVMSRQTGELFEKKDLITINYSDGLLFSAITNDDTDTVAVRRYPFSGYLFDKFPVFKFSYETLVITSFDNDSIQFLHNAGLGQSNQFKMKRVE